MTAGARSRAGDTSPWGLRLVHAGVFLVLAAVPLGAALPEWRHVARALSRPFHAGAPPRWLLLVASVVAAVGTARLLVGLARRRSAPLWASLAVLAGVGATLASGRRPPEERSEPRANLAFLASARRVHLEMVGQLQSAAAVPVEVGPWQAALERARRDDARVADRTFRAVPPRVVRVAEPDSRAEPVVPGDLWLFVTPDGVSFSLRVVGLEAGQPALLRDETGAPLVLRGLFNPDLPDSGPAAPLLP
ncbi:hypothetical protein HPC49_38410 [Pyxidicoccus fallax]|uniref:Uncharacterized protein n=1 Tax=Pyxidicoccus fallax TaxID=394095 RepID=A0A848LWV0_9BACT|nr:hypothetical protein [Pyxidicoccus fallax]NMO21754.1 hypothetical protein [Pyxidicoccus fallax]NPC84074.1 hypothetical protein [Pyxidicoccus fallax]